MHGEMYVVGGAAMNPRVPVELQHDRHRLRLITNGTDTIHQAAAEIAEERPGLGADWLNETAARRWPRGATGTQQRK